MKTRHALTWLLTAACTLLPLSAQDGLRSGGALIPEQSCYDVLWYGLAVEVFPEEQRLRGNLGLRARLTADTDRIALDLHRNLEVDKVSSEAEALRHTRDPRVQGDRVLIELGRTRRAGETVELDVAYGGKPRVAKRPPWDGGLTWARTADGAPWIATSCQGEGADLWWPCKDHPSDEPSTMDLWFTGPDDLVNAANGTLEQSTDNGNGTRTWHWKVHNPINVYCVTLNFAPYETIERTYECVDGTKLPVTFWVLPEKLEGAAKALDGFLDHLRHMEETCGPYPFRNEKYGVVHTPFLGMEHQTAIAYGNDYRKISYDYDWLHHHEMSHEWWGNMVTCNDWKDMWIHEGIGTYMQALYVERKLGPKAYRAKIGDDHRLMAGRRAIAPRGIRDSKEIYFDREGVSDSDIYYKGSLVMHSLRWLLGDETFFVALRRLAYPDPALEKVADGSQCRHEDTEGVKEIVEKVSGRDLDWFFEVYLRQGELPRLVVERNGAQLDLAWQAPEVAAFPMPVEVEIDGERRRIELPEGRATVELPDAESEVVVDPDRWLILRAK